MSPSWPKKYSASSTAPLEPTACAAAATFEVWLFDLTQAPSAQELSFLSHAEQQRAAQFAFARHRQRYQAARCGLRRVLGSRLGLAPQDLALAEGAFGKPGLVGPARCEFNLSHSEDVAVLAIGQDAGNALGMGVGVDVEHIRHMDDTHALARLHFSAAEQQQLQACRPEAQVAAFLRGWARKEAALKAVGCGLSVAAQSFELGLAAASAVARIDTPGQRWWVEVHSFEPAAGLVGALARVLRVAPG